MNNNFIITSIGRVAFVGKNEYVEKVTKFTYNYSYYNELIFNLEGYSTVFFNGKVLENKKDAIRFLPKGEITEYIVDRKEHGECFVICFDTNIPISTEAFMLKAKNSTVIKNLFKKVFAVWVAKNDGYYFECISLLYKIFAELQKQNYIPENQYLTIKPAIDYISENFLNKKISLSHLASLCNISEPYFKKLFTKKYNLSPIRYIIQLKVNYASDLLSTGLYTITQVSEKCGYNNVYYFSRQFKEYVGITPTDFLNKYKSSK